MTCNPCEGTGFQNTHQIPGDYLGFLTPTLEGIQCWILAQTEPHDVQVCDCCGDGETWWNEPGHHHEGDDMGGFNDDIPPCI